MFFQEHSPWISSLCFIVPTYNNFVTTQLPTIIPNFLQGSFKIMTTFVEEFERFSLPRHPHLYISILLSACVEQWLNSCTIFPSACNNFWPHNKLTTNYTLIVLWFDVSLHEYLLVSLMPATFTLEIVVKQPHSNLTLCSCIQFSSHLEGNFMFIISVYNMSNLRVHIAQKIGTM